MKRIFDIVIALLMVVLLSPIILLLSGVILLRLGRPVLFRQDRVGCDNKIFELVKFRSMLTVDEVRTSDEQRLTPFGIWLRSTSLDELPELWNVIKGDMSLVGPRPLLVQYLPLYSERQSHRHHVHPGLTGWAQINGRNTLTWKEKFELDVWYVENRTFFLDIKILFLTLFMVLKREGISAKSEATMPYFNGDN